ncbi:hypothetical protein BXZ70DRAFT_698222 [Cristinia sonorae]|uniref:Uncharacterized protein n=1 Tax=Cristinia sonorae TaxID=1940300 RepID=A0A8K0UE44_9AGAR|nr:hypothetical protein BXZ70DRAFT_698222 [Cristinia sonorae]
MRPRKRPRILPPAGSSGGMMAPPAPVHKTQTMSREAQNTHQAEQAPRTMVAHSEPAPHDLPVFYAPHFNSKGEYIAPALIVPIEVTLAKFFPELYNNTPPGEMPDPDSISRVFHTNPVIASKTNSGTQPITVQLCITPGCTNIVSRARQGVHCTRCRRLQLESTQSSASSSSNGSARQHQPQQPLFPANPPVMVPAGGRRRSSHQLVDGPAGSVLPASVGMSHRNTSHAGSAPPELPTLIDGRGGMIVASESGVGHQQTVSSSPGAVSGKGQRGNLDEGLSAGSSGSSSSSVVTPRRFLVERVSSTTESPNLTGEAPSGTAIAENTSSDKAGVDVVPIPADEPWEEPSSPVFSSHHQDDPMDVDAPEPPGADQAASIPHEDTNPSVRSPVTAETTHPLPESNDAPASTVPAIPASSTTSPSGTTTPSTVRIDVTDRSSRAPSETTTTLVASSPATSFPKKTPRIILRLPSHPNLLFSPSTQSTINADTNASSPRRKLPRVILKVRAPVDASSSSDEDDSSSDDEEEEGGGERRGEEETSILPSFRSLGLDWESDVSDLTPIEDSEESEVERADSESEDDVPLSTALVQTKTTSASVPSVPVPKREATHCARTKRVTCSNLLHPAYPGIVCEGCLKRERTQQRRNQREREKKALLLLTQGHRLCMGPGCDHVLAPEYQLKLCTKCRNTSPEKGGKRGSAKTASSLSSKTPSTTAQQPTPPAHTRSFPSIVYPTYQDFAFLLDDFHSRFSGFLQAQTTYLRLKVLEAQRARAIPSGADGWGKSIAMHVNPTVFTFDAEFSVVADPSGGDMTLRIDSMRAAILGVVGRMLGTSYTNDKIFSTPDGFVVGKSKCRSDMPVYVPSASMITPLPAPLSLPPAAAPPPEIPPARPPTTSDIVSKEPLAPTLQSSPPPPASPQPAPWSLDDIIHADHIENDPAEASDNRESAPDIVPPATASTPEGPSSAPQEDSQSLGEASKHVDQPVPPPITTSTSTPAPPAREPDPLPSASVPQTVKIKSEEMDPCSVPLPDTMSSSQHHHTPEHVETTTVVMRNLYGDLEVALCWDRRHKFFPGLRTVIKFKLVG